MSQIILCDFLDCEYRSPSGYCKSLVVHIRGDSLQCTIPIFDNGRRKPKANIRAKDPIIDTGVVVDDR